MPLTGFWKGPKGSEEVWSPLNFEEVHHGEKLQSTDAVEDEGVLGCRRIMDATKLP